MSAESTGTLTWAVGEIARALRIGVEDVREYFTDGRRVSFLMERRMAHEVLRGRLAPSEGAGYDVLDAEGGKWEVRSISRRGVYFCPSYMVGSGRSFDEEGFLRKLADVRGYIIADIESFPNVPYWIVPVDVVRNWWNAGLLGTTSKVSRQAVLRLLRRLSQ